MYIYIYIYTVDTCILHVKFLWLGGRLGWFLSLFLQLGCFTVGTRSTRFERPAVSTSNGLWARFSLPINCLTSMMTSQRSWGAVTLPWSIFLCKFSGTSSRVSPGMGSVQTNQNVILSYFIFKMTTRKLMKNIHTPICLQGKPCIRFF